MLRPIIIWFWWSNYISEFLKKYFGYSITSSCCWSVLPRMYSLLWCKIIGIMVYLLVMHVSIYTCIESRTVLHASDRCLYCVHGSPPSSKNVVPSTRRRADTVNASRRQFVRDSPSPTMDYHNWFKGRRIGHSVNVFLLPQVYESLPVVQM